MPGITSDGVMIGGPPLMCLSRSEARARQLHGSHRWRNRSTAAPQLHWGFRFDSQRTGWRGGGGSGERWRGPRRDAV